MAVCDMVDAGHTIVFDSEGSYAVNKRDGTKWWFARVGKGWELSLDLEAPERANQEMSRIMAEMREVRKTEPQASPQEHMSDSGDEDSRRQSFQLAVRRST